MKKIEHKILVPVDFSTASLNAVEYALHLAPSFACGITLLHLVEDEEYKERGEREMFEFLKNFNSDVSIKTFVLCGEILQDIAKAAELLEVYMVVMGTHKLSGLDFLFGSKALKIVTSASSPFLMTQEDSKFDSINNIVVPIDLASEDKHILSLALQSARLFNSKIHLFIAHHEDEFSRNNTFRNEQFAKKFLTDHEVHFTTVHAEGKNAFDTEILEYAELINAELITVVNHKETGFLNLFGKNFDQNLVGNSFGIPVLIMNANEHKKITDIFDVFV